MVSKETIIYLWTNVRMRIIILRYNVPKPSEICKICMSARQLQRFFDFIMGDDLDFYVEYTVNLTEVEREKFFRIIQILCWRVREGVIEYIRCEIGFIEEF